MLEHCIYRYSAGFLGLLSIAADDLQDAICENSTRSGMQQHQVWVSVQFSMYELNVCMYAVLAADDNITTVPNPMGILMFTLTRTLRLSMNANSMT